MKNSEDSEYVIKWWKYWNKNRLVPSFGYIKKPIDIKHCYKKVPQLPNDTVCPGIWSAGPLSLWCSSGSDCADFTWFFSFRPSLLLRWFSYDDFYFWTADFLHSFGLNALLRFVSNADLIGFRSAGYTRVFSVNIMIFLFSITNSEPKTLLLILIVNSADLNLFFSVYVIHLLFIIGPGVYKRLAFISPTFF